MATFSSLTFILIFSSLTLGVTTAPTEVDTTAYTTDSDTTGYSITFGTTVVTVDFVTMRTFSTDTPTVEGPTDISSISSITPETNSDTTTDSSLATLSTISGSPGDTTTDSSSATLSTTSGSPGDTTTDSSSASVSATSGSPGDTVSVLSTSTVSSTFKNTGMSCENGGYYDGIGCICPEFVYGKTCEFISNEIRPVKVVVKVKVTVYIVNLNFSEDLLDQDSGAYRNFTTLFRDQMNNFYSNSVPTYFKEVQIIAISKGSIRVDHEVHLQLDSKQIQEQHAEAVKEIRKFLNESNCASTENVDDILCFNSSRSIVSGQDTDVSGLCSTGDLIPKELQAYFYGILTPDQGFLCVSNCSQSNKYFKECNRGQCLVNSKGADCYCETSSEFWHTGDQCQTAISKAGVYGGVAVGLAVLVIVIVVLSVLLHRARKL